MTSPLCWNDPKKTWKSASYQPPTERRKTREERRSDTTRAAVGDRRVIAHRALGSLRRL